MCGYARTHKPLLVWRNSECGNDHSARLDASWKRFDTQIRPYLDTSGDVDMSKAGWAHSHMSKDYYATKFSSDDKPLMLEIAERGQGSKGREQAVIGVLKTILHPKKVSALA